jgi:hypothetical protein
MAVALSTLRVNLEADTSKYADAMRQKVGADQAAIASSGKLGEALARQDVAAGTSSGTVARLSKISIDGYGSAAKHAQGIKQLGDALDRGAVSTERATAIVEGLNKKYNQTADVVDLARRGHAQLASIVADANTRFVEGGQSASIWQKGLSGISAQLVALSAGAGPVGTFLAGLGPIGLAAAVGIGAVEKAVTAASKACHDATGQNAFR